MIKYNLKCILKYYCLFLMLKVIIIIEANNLTEWSKLRRHRRSLIFQNSGTIKFVGGITFPMNLEDPVPYRQLLVAYNMQAQYSLPTTSAQLIPPWTGRLLEEAMLKYDKFNLYVNDQSQTLIYTMLLVYFDKTGRNGKICLQNAICKNSQIDIAEGIFSEIVQAILTPKKVNSDKDFYDAYQAGRYGIDCNILYSQCQHGDNFLDKLIFTVQ